MAVVTDAAAVMASVMAIMTANDYNIYVEFQNLQIYVLHEGLGF